MMVLDRRDLALTTATCHHCQKPIRQVPAFLAKTPIYGICAACYVGIGDRKPRARGKS